MPAHRLVEPSRTQPRGFALWALGFRPFYLLGAAYAALSVALWVLQFSGRLPFEALPGPSWHGHEMIFGFALAIVSGFLLTAVRTWTQQPTASGWTLAALVALWAAGRVLAYAPWPLAAAVANVAYPFVLAAAIAIPLARARNRRNYFFIALLCGVGVAVLAMHLSALDVIDVPLHVSLRVSLDLLLFVVAVVSGRLIPMFTNNGVPGAGASRSPPLEFAALAVLLALLAADIVEAPPVVITIVAAMAAAAHACRLLLWRPWRTARAPLVWALHAAYAWIPIHLAMRALAEQDLVRDVLATHALTVGVLGGMTLGMMTRTALGHTGRRLHAGRVEVACYVLVQLAAVARVAGGLLAFEHYVATVEIAALLWCSAYALYAVRYWPILTRPRVDGRPG